MSVTEFTCFLLLSIDKLLVFLYFIPVYSYCTEHVDFTHNTWNIMDELNKSICTYCYWVYDCYSKKLHANIFFLIFFLLFIAQK